MSPVVTVALENGAGHIITTYDSLVTMSFATGGGLGPFAPGSTVSVTAVNGVATFSNLSIDIAGGYLLQASDAYVTSANSSPFIVTPAAASGLAVFQQPSSTTAGVAISPAVIVDVVDQFGNLETTNTSTVTIGVASGPGSFDTSSKLSVAASGGIATFSKLILDTAGNYTLNASDGELAGTTSNTFNVVAAAASKLIITTQPSNATAGAALSPAMTVALEDKYGNLATANDSTVTVTVASGPTTAFDASSTQTAVVNGGIATLSNVILDKAGSYTLKFSDPGLTAATSSSFTVSAAAPSKLVIATQPTNVVAGVAISPGLVVDVKDQYGNLVTTDGSTVAVAVASGPNSNFDPNSTLSATASGGVATLSNVILDTSGSYTLIFSDGELATATSSSFKVSAAAASQLAILTQPSNATAGVANSPAVTVAIEDQYGNIATTNTSTVTISVASGPTTTFDTSSKLTVAASGGVATFSKLILDTAGNYTLNASDSTLANATSNSFNVAAAAASQLVFFSQPSNTIAGVAINPAVTAFVMDKFGNLVTTDSSLVTISVASGPVTTFDASSALSVAASGGIATFSNLILDTAGNYRLKASDGALMTAASSGFTVSPAAATQLVFITQPTTAVHGHVIATAPQVAVEDQYSNIVTIDNSSQIVMSGNNLTGTTTVTVVNGIATFSNLTILQAGTTKLTAIRSVGSGGGLTSATSGSINVS